jgi:hypothetical protein
LREGVCNVNQALAGPASHQPVHVHLASQENEKVRLVMAEEKRRSANQVVVIKSGTAHRGEGPNNVAHELERQHRERRFRRVEMGEQNQRSTVHHLFLHKHVSLLMSTTR